MSCEAQFHHHHLPVLRSVPEKRRRCCRGLLGLPGNTGQNHQVRSIRASWWGLLDIKEWNSLILKPKGIWNKAGVHPNGGSLPCFCVLRGLPSPRSLLMPINSCQKKHLNLAIIKVFWKKFMEAPWNMRCLSRYWAVDLNLLNAKISDGWLYAASKKTSAESRLPIRTTGTWWPRDLVQPHYGNPICSWSTHQIPAHLKIRVDKCMNLWKKLA